MSEAIYKRVKLYEFLIGFPEIVGGSYEVGKRFDIFLKRYNANLRERADKNTRQAK